jgi:hypothetical protein
MLPKIEIEVCLPSTFITFASVALIASNGLLRGACQATITGETIKFSRFRGLISVQ